MTPTLSNGSRGLVPVGRAPLVGDVAEFDEQRGLGSIEYGPGQVVPFHCTAITDGTRRIDVGAVVSFRIAAGRLGCLEARSVRPLPGVVAPGSTLAPGQVGRSESGAGVGGRSAQGDGSVQVGQPAAGSVPAGPAPAGPAPAASEPAVSESPAPDAPAVWVPAVSEPAVSEPAASESPAPEAPAWPADPTDATPPSGIPPVAPAPQAVTAAPSSTDSLPSPPTGVSEAAHEESPRPNFWSLNPRPPSGPPPTWVTPVTRREPPSPSDSD